MKLAAARPLQPAGKAERQRAILELVRGRAIRTQVELVDALHRRRLEVSQATVSRDLRALGLVRLADAQGSRYVIGAGGPEDGAPSAARLRAVLRDHVRSVEFVEILGVVRARPSTAPLVAAAIDAARLAEVAGTVAGDDTVMLVTRSRAAALRLRARLSDLLEGQG